MSNHPGWDARAIARIAKKKRGGFQRMFEAHEWPERGVEMMPKVQSRIVEAYGSVAYFVRHHESEPD